jgi:putative flippase GtrA
VSFALVGVVNASVDFGVFSFFYFYLAFPIILANLISWFVAVTGSYVMNSMTTFAVESGRKLRLRSYATFLLAQVAGFVANTTTVYFIPKLIGKMLAMDSNTTALVLTGKLFAIGASFLVNFSLSHFVVFRHREQSTSH